MALKTLSLEHTPEPESSSSGTITPDYSYDGGNTTGLQLEKNLAVSSTKIHEELIRRKPEKLNSEEISIITDNETRNVNKLKESLLSGIKNAKLGSKASVHYLPHIIPIHKKGQPSILTHVAIHKYATETPPKFTGFMNLAMMVLVVGNLRLIVENYQKYGILTQFYSMSIGKQDLVTGTILFLLTPLHLFIALLIEVIALKLRSPKLKKFTKVKVRVPFKPKHLWRIFFSLHILNCIFVLAITTYFVHFKIFHPLIGTICEVHALILCLKVCSYALTNRDLRDMYAKRYSRKDKETTIANKHIITTYDMPLLYKEHPYPENISLSNLIYFWWAPTLVYQPVYPRTEKRSWTFIARCVAEMIFIGWLVIFITGQYAVPTLEHSLEKFHELDYIGMLERLMKLATISMVEWLLGFFFIFQSYLNCLAEIMRFADRDFYQDWWNSGSVGTYWRLWNKPVTNYFKRHIYIPCLNRGWTSMQASLVVFLVSAVLHELLVGIPTHNILGVAFLAMIFQAPLIWVTQPLEAARGRHTTIGNCIFWLSFLLGQPFGVLLYYFAWQIRFGGR